MPNTIVPTSESNLALLAPASRTGLQVSLLGYFYEALCRTDARTGGPRYHFVLRQRGHTRGIAVTGFIHQDDDHIGREQIPRGHGPLDTPLERFRTTKTQGGHRGVGAHRRRRWWHLPPHLAVADPVEAALDLGKASFDHRLELAVGENVGPVVLDTFTHELAHVEWVNAATDALG